MIVSILATLSLASTLQSKPTALPPIQIAVRPDPLSQKTDLLRGELADLQVTLVEGTSASGKLLRLRLLRPLLSTGSNRPRGRSSAPVFETSVFVLSAPDGTPTAQFRVPLKSANGTYRLEAELAGVGKSAAIAVRVSDPPVRILNFSPAKTVGGTLVFIANFAPPGSQFIVTRTQNAPFREEWWAPYKSVAQKSVVLTPNRTENPDGTVRLAAVLPVKMGAGKFQARMQPPNATEAAENHDFAFDYPPVPSPLYTLRLESIECLEETDEIGDDEIYAIHMIGITKPSDYQGYLGIKTVLTEPMVMTEGRSRHLDQDLYSFEKVGYPLHLVWAVALLENDDDIPKGYENAVAAGGWQRIMKEPYNSASVGGLIVDAIHGEQRKQGYHSNNDDYIGWSFVPLDDGDLREARRNEGWHAKSVVIRGDGGKYMLTFSVSAQPKPIGK